MLPPPFQNQNQPLESLKQTSVVPVHFPANVTLYWHYFSLWRQSGITYSVLPLLREHQADPDTRRHEGNYILTSCELRVIHFLISWLLENSPSPSPYTSHLNPAVFFFPSSIFKMERCCYLSSQKTALQKLRGEQPAKIFHHERFMPLYWHTASGILRAFPLGLPVLGWPGTALPFRRVLSACPTLQI